MDIYLPLYIILLCVGAVMQGGYALLQLRGLHVPFMLAAAGAAVVLGSAWIERDVLLGCGQIFLLYILWRLGAKAEGGSA